MSDDKEHLVPELLKDIARSSKTAKPNEWFQIEARLNAIISFCQKVIREHK